MRQKLTLSGLRGDLGWSRAQLASVMNASDRAIVNWEAGEPMSPVYAAKLREIQSVCHELKQLMKPEEIGSWLLNEMEEFHSHPIKIVQNPSKTEHFWCFAMWWDGMSGFFTQ